MKNTIKKFLAAVFALSLLVLSGCSHGGEKETTPDESTTEAVQTTKSPEQEKIESNMFKRTNGFWVDLSSIEKVGNDNSFFGVFFDDTELFFSTYLGSRVFPAEIEAIEKSDKGEYLITVNYSADASDDGKEETLIEKIKIEDGNKLFIQADTTTFTYMGEDFASAKKAVDEYVKEKEAQSEKNTEPQNTEEAENTSD